MHAAVVLHRAHSLIGAHAKWLLPTCWPMLSRLGTDLSQDCMNPDHLHMGRAVSYACAASLAHMQ